MNRIAVILIFSIFVFHAYGQSMTVERAAELGMQFRPQSVVDAFTNSYTAAGYNEIKHLKDIPTLIHEAEAGYWFRYLNFKMPNDPKEYLLLAWGSYQVYFRLLESADSGQTWALKQDPGYWVGGCDYGFKWRLADWTNDGIPELVWEHTCIGWGLTAHFGTGLHVFQWVNGKFVPILGYFDDNNPTWLNGRGADQIDITDIDGDKIPEVVLSPNYNNVKDTDITDAEGNYISFHTEIEGNWEIYRYDGSKYVLWKTYPGEDNYPITVPTTGIFYPSTIPLSELSNPGKGKMSVFITAPAGKGRSVDDIDNAKFTCSDYQLSFKKRWANNKYPDLSFANQSLMGMECPVRWEQRNSSGEWQTDPTAPFLLSADEKIEIHFVGPYLEIEVPREAIFSFLLKAANDGFSSNPAKDKWYVSVPISGKMKNGKLLSVSALVCVKKTGNNLEAKKGLNDELKDEKAKEESGEKEKK